EAGSGNWDITNEGGTCVWKVWDISTNPYTMPPEAMFNIMAADADICGSGTSTITTATLSSVIIHEGFQSIFIEWDNDWRIIDAKDEAFVEASSDGGNNWEIIWSRIGVSERNSHEDVIYINDLAVNTLVRFRAIQPGWDWWWAIDNVEIIGFGPIEARHPPNLLQAVSDSLQLQVHLNWNSGNCVDPISGYMISRKEGLPADSSSYSILTITDENTFTYTDNSIQLNKTYTYKIRTLCFGPSIWGNEATAYVPKIIPVELTTFTASVSGNDVQLNWSTATEWNNLGFEIHRTTNKDEWNKIGFVPGNGTTTEQQHYSFIDESVSSGKYQYRLKQIDYDGTFEYSDIVELEVGLPTVFSLEQNYPNPFNPSTKINYKISELSLVTLKIYDVLGNEIAILVNKEKPAGSYEIEFYATALTSGIYFYRLQAGNFVETKKLVLMK
ncbi:MAG: T9SS type A sorting domain-containing protein, partial [Ignavibacteria bacterium]|nr:T9SS type A sorting domain-containing protein [Ignavibacteria bacterium]